MWQPRLIDIDDSLTFSQYLEHLLGVLHSHDEAALGVALELHLLEYAISHIEVVVKNVTHSIERDTELFALEQVTLDLLRCPHMLPSLNVLLDFLLESVVLHFFRISFFREGSVRMLRVSYCLDQSADERWPDITELGSFNLAEALL